MNTEETVQQAEEKIVQGEEVQPQTVVENKQEQSEQQTEQQLLKKRFIKAKVAIFFGYNGQQYRGLQFQKENNVPTVEKALFEALCAANLISVHNRDSITKCQWTRGARTDKGVHALVNVITVRLDVGPEYQNEGAPNLAMGAMKGEKEAQRMIRESQIKRQHLNKPKIVGAINSNLPADLRVYTYKFVSKSFNVRTKGDARTYEYCMPIFAYKRAAEAKQKDEEGGNSAAAEAQQPAVDEDEQIVQRLQLLCQKFLGTHNFHNYTIKISPKDDRARRFIMQMDAKLVEESGEKFVSFKLQGQSFIYHQIRKMMGILVMIFQQDHPNQFLENTFFSNRYHIWLAPAEGLFLNRISFRRYDIRGDISEPMEFDESEERQIEEFRAYLQRVVFSAEREHAVFSTWLKDKILKPDAEDDNDADYDREEGASKEKGIESE